MRRLTLVFLFIAALGLVPSAAAWTWPLGGDVLRPYSLGPDAYAAGQHRGVDVAGAGGESVRAPASGAVSFAGVVPGSGRTVTIQLDGYAVSLTHLGEISVVKGATVAEGQPIGVAGQSGDAEWPTPYVHLGIRVSAAAEGYVDPTTLLPPRAIAPPPALPTPVAAPVADPVVAPVADPVVTPVAVPPVAAPVVTPVAVPVAAPVSTRPPATAPVAGVSPIPSPLGQVSASKPVAGEAPPTPAVDQTAIRPGPASSSAGASLRDGSTARLPRVGTSGATVQSALQSGSQTTRAAGSRPTALSTHRAVRPAHVGSGAPSQPGVPKQGSTAAAATGSVGHGVPTGVLPAIPARASAPRERGADAPSAARVSSAPPSGSRMAAPQARAATVREGSTTEAMSLLQRGRRSAAAVAALLLAALGTIWLLARVRRPDGDAEVLGYRHAPLGRHAAGAAAAGVRGTDVGRPS